MKFMRRSACVVFFLWIAIAASAQNGEQQFAALGDFKLESGEVIRDCRIGYRVFGQLNATKSNAVLFMSWFTGTSQDLADFVGPGRLADRSKYYVIAVDALGNGVSSSPSNSTQQPRMRFPRFSIRDLVNTQHQLLMNQLHIAHVRAVMGISMGGMQALQWQVSYADFMDQSISITGTPRPTAYDLTLLQSLIEANTNDPEWKNGEYKEQPRLGARTVAEILNLALSTPESYNQENSRGKWQEAIGEMQKGVFAGDANDRIRQLQAIMDQDITAGFGGSLAQAAQVFHGRQLFVIANGDHMVNPAPALEFARLAKAEVFVLKGECGHMSPQLCERASAEKEVGSFLGTGHGP
jgi:homoserine O-acetyltransferase/O-succinyltransferase